MKKFANPEIQVEKLDVAEVIATSTCEQEIPNCPTDTGMG